MSHTTSIDGIMFTDLDALRGAVNELAAKGVRCSLRNGGTPRAYYADQKGLGPAAYVLHLDDSPYDIGFYKDGAKNQYVARTDLFGGHVNRLLGTAMTAGENPSQAHMGKLYNTYAVHAATRKAVQQGMTVRRVNHADGSVQLVLGGIK